MIPEIQEVNFPSYATLHQATVSLVDMGERTITTQLKVHGSIVPEYGVWNQAHTEFSPMELRFRGERFILPIREPQASKDNTSLASLSDLTFYSWPIYQLKRYFYFEPASVGSGTAMADKYVTPVRLNLTDFVSHYNTVLDHYFDGKIVIRLNPNVPSFSSEVQAFDINYSKLWDVLTKVYGIYTERWSIAYDSQRDVYTITVGATEAEVRPIEHVFQYGHEGGLLKFERQVQDPAIYNHLLGRGGEQNVPYRYFKREDPQNPLWSADPDALYELKDIYFDRLRDMNFRWYVRGWMQNSNRNRTWELAGYNYPYYSLSQCPDKYKYAFNRGKTDGRFDPVEFVKDDDSTEKYGEIWGALEDNDDIYPTIQGAEDPSFFGRYDEVVGVPEIWGEDDPTTAAKASIVERSLYDMTRYVDFTPTPDTPLSQTSFYLNSQNFYVPQGKVALVYYAWGWKGKDDANEENITIDTDRSYVSTEGGRISASGTKLTAGTYHLSATVYLNDARGASDRVNGTIAIKNIRIIVTDENEYAWKPTFDIWVKNIWGTQKQTTIDPSTGLPTASETDEEYAERVWRPILGDKLGREAKVAFSTGFMATSDYEFVIAKMPVYDTSKQITVHSEGYWGTHSVNSEWRITVYKSDAEYDATGRFIPSDSTGKPAAGDKFFFTGIELPWEYVYWAEERLTDFKVNSLDGYSEIDPSWAITLDKVRVHTLEDEEEVETLASQIKPGIQINIKDPRFTGTNGQWVYAQSVTYRWDAATNSEARMLPDIEVVLSNSISPTESAFARLQGDVATITSTYMKEGDVETTIRRVASTLFLKKTGEDDYSTSPTTFAARVSSADFRQGVVDGTGWGLYTDDTNSHDADGPKRRSKAVPSAEPNTGSSTLEVDNLIVRNSMQVNEITVNQITYTGGKQICSAASLVVSDFEDIDEYLVNIYFDEKQGTVRNHFQKDDIIWGQIFDENNIAIDAYKGVVTKVGADYIRVDFSLNPSLGRPKIGDTIVQFGSTSIPARQYAIIRDVIGGGYEKMLAGLTIETVEVEDPETGEVTEETRFTDGIEYYFAGRQTGDTDRWFIGRRNGEYAEWHNGQLNIKGRLTVRKSDGSYQAMTTYMDNVQSQIDNKAQSWIGIVDPLPIDEEGTVDPSTANYPANQWTTNEERLKHLGDIYVNKTSGQGWQYVRQPNDGDFYWIRISDAELKAALEAISQDVHSLEYLKAALGEDTIIEGGLILTSLIQLGRTESGVFKVYSGINGTFDEQLTDPKRSIAAWYGGPMTDHEQYPSAASYAQSLFRMDGSGYVARGAISWTNDGVLSIGPTATIDQNATVGNNTFGDFVQGLSDISTLQGNVSTLQNDFGGLSYLTDSLQNGGTAIVNGLILSSAMGLGYSDQGGYHVTAGMNGNINDSYIAAWYGGEMRDKENPRTGETSGFAKSLFRHDGSGYVADGKISWTTGGSVTIDGGTVIGGGQTTPTLSDLVSRGDYWKVGGSGTGHFYLYLGDKDGSNFLYASAPYFKSATGYYLGDNAIISAGTVSGTANLSRIAKIRYASAAAQDDASIIEWDTTRSAWHFHGAIYADSYVSSGGINSESGGSGGGDAVSWTQEALSGISKTQIATIRINGNDTIVYAPSGEVTSVAGLKGIITESALRIALGLNGLANYGVANSITQNDTTHLATSAAVWSAINALPAPMVFKGSLGTGGTITSLPTASASNNGWTYKVITAGTYGSQAAKVGDLFISNGSVWIYIPSGDEPSGTVTSIGLSLPTGLELQSGDTNPITGAGVFHIQFSSGYSIPTTTKQTEWDDKYTLPVNGIPKEHLASAVQTSLTAADNAVPNTRKVNGYALSADVTVTAGDVGLGSVDNLAAADYFTDFSNGESGDDVGKVCITVGTTKRTLAIGYAASAGNADTLGSHAPSYFATATSVTTLQGYFTNGIANNADKLDNHDSAYFATAASVTTLQGYFTDGVANNADKLDGHDSAYFATATSVTTLQGYFTNGVANSAAKLSDNAAKTVWGQTFFNNGVPQSVSGDLRLGTGKIYFGTGDTHYIELDANGLHFSDGLYSDSFVSSGGIGTGGSGGGTTVAWGTYSNGYRRLVVDGDPDSDTAHSTVALQGHIHADATTSAAGFMSASDKAKLNGIATGATAVTENTVTGWGFTKNAGTVTRVDVGTSQYSPSSGVVSLPAYPTTLPASDVYPWAKAETKPTYTASEVGAATSGHTHTTSIATSTATNQITLGYGSKYVLTAGGTSYVFTMPSLGTSNTTAFRGDYGNAAYSHATDSGRIGTASGSTAKIYKLTYSAEGHISSASAATKTDITALGIPAQDTTYTSNTDYVTITGANNQIDLSSGVKTSLGKADSALQSHQTIYTLTIKNSANTAVLTYTPNSSDASLKLTQAMVGLDAVSNLAASGYLTEFDNVTTGDNAGKVKITVGGTSKYLAVAKATDADTLDGQHGSYYATASGLTAVSNRVTTLEGRTNWDTYFGIDNDGNVYVKDNGSSPRGFYTNGFVSSGGIGSGGTGGGDAVSWSQEALSGVVTKKIATITINGNDTPVYAPWGEVKSVIGLKEEISQAQLRTALGLGSAAYETKGAANGVASLDANGLVPSSQLPSYVDDVLEYASRGNFPTTGTSGKIYVALDTNLTYRWGGTAYVEISPSLALGATSSTAFRGDYGNTAYTHATDSSRVTTAQTTSALYKITYTAQGHIASATAATGSDLATLIGNTTFAPYNSNGYVPTTRTVNGHALSADVTVTAEDVGLGSVTNLAASGYFTDFSNGTGDDLGKVCATIGGTTKKLEVGYAATAGDSAKLGGTAKSGLFTAFENITSGDDANKVSVTIGGTNKKLTVGYASNAGTLGGNAASYFATASSVSTLNGYFSSGVLTYNHGGTGLSSYTKGDIIYASAANTLSTLDANATATKKWLSMTSSVPSWVTLAKGDVGLGDVENTKLSTWTGSTYISTLGTITTGTWHGTAIANAYLANSAITINGSSTSLGGSFSTASITAGTAGTSSATSGATLSVPYLTLNQYGIVTGYGTHTHTINNLANSALQNSSITIGSTAVSLGSTITNLTGLGSISAAGALTLTTTKKIYFGDTSHYLELDSNGFHFSHGVYSDSFVSSGGLGTGGSGGGTAVSWEAPNNGYRHLIVDGDPYASNTAYSTVALQGHVHSNATTSAAGFMSSTDKTKLDGIVATNNTTNKLYIIGATAQTGSLQTYSSTKCYIQGDYLYSNNSLVATQSWVNNNFLTGNYITEDSGVIVDADPDMIPACVAVHDYVHGLITDNGQDIDGQDHDLVPTCSAVFDYIDNLVTNNKSYIVSGDSGYVPTCAAVHEYVQTAVPANAVFTDTWRPIQVGGVDKLTDSSTKINFAGSGATSVSYSNGTITISSTNTTYTFSDSDATLSWGTRSKIATVGGTDIHVTLPSNPNSWRPIQVNGSPIGEVTMNLKNGSNISITNSNGEVTIANTYSYTLPTAGYNTKGGVYLNDRGAEGNPVYFDDNGYSHAIGYLNIASEDSTGMILPHLYNDLSFLQKRGGSCVITVDGTEDTSDNSAIFDSRPEFWGCSSASTLVVTINLPTDDSFSWGNKFYIDFGSTSWAASNITLRAYNGSSEISVSGGSVTGWDKCYWYCSVNGGSSGMTRLVLTLSGFDNAPRIYEIGLIRFSSKGASRGYMSRGVNDDVWRDISPADSNTYNLGYAGHLWSALHVKDIYFDYYGSNIYTPNGNSDPIMSVWGSSSNNYGDIVLGHSSSSAHRDVHVAARDNVYLEVKGNSIGIVHNYGLTIARGKNLYFNTNNGYKQAMYLSNNETTLTVGSNDFLASGYSTVVNGNQVIVQTGTSASNVLTISDSSAHFTVGVYSDSYVSAGGVSSSSDIRLKDNLRPVELTLTDVANAPAVEFEWKKDGSKGAGSIAQYWENILPYNVRKNDEGMMSLEYGNIALLSTITVAREVERLKARIVELENRLNA